MQQTITSAILIAGAVLAALMASLGMAGAVLWHFGFSPEAMFAGAVKIKTDLALKDGKTAEVAASLGQSIMGPGNFVKDPISAISFGMALMFGTAGLPHILMRFFTVPDARAARHSVFVATGLLRWSRGKATLVEALAWPRSPAFRTAVGRTMKGAAADINSQGKSIETAASAVGADLLIDGPLPTGGGDLPPLVDEGDDVTQKLSTGSSSSKTSTPRALSPAGSSPTRRPR